MDIRHLEYFVAVAKYGSFTKAARQLYVTQPTISKMIKTLEDELGVVLLCRSGKQMTLTDTGKAVFRQAQSIVTSFQSLADEIDNVMNLQKGEIKIGLPPMVGARFFPYVIGEFNRLYPQVHIQLTEVGSKSVERRIEAGILDAGVVMLPVSSREFCHTSFARDPVMVIVHPAHQLADRKEVSLFELQNEPFILFREDFALHDRILDSCAQRGFQPKVICTSAQWDFMMEMVAANLGIAFLPERICEHLDQGRVKIILLTDPSIFWDLALVWHKDRYLSYAAREFIAFTGRVLGQPPEQ